MEQHGKNIEAQNMIAAGIAVRKGDLNLEIGRVQQARQEYDKCLAIFLALERDAALPSPFHNLSKIHFLRAVASRSAGEFELADQQFAKSLEIRRKWQETEPTTQSKMSLANVLAEYGVLALDRGDLSEARSMLDEALEIRTQMHREKPKVGNRFRDLQTAKMRLAKVEFQSERTDRGLELIQEAATGMTQAGQMESE